MKRLLSMILFDMKFQFRQGFYFAYFIVTVFYAALLWFLPVAISQKVLPFVLFTDISVLGFFFIGGILLLERGQNSLSALFVTPIKVQEYLLAKVISLSILSSIATLALYITVQGKLSFLPALLAIVWINMFIYTLLGIALVSQVKKINDYFIYGVPVGLVLFIPLLSFFDIFEFPLFYLLPTEPTLELLCGSFSIQALVIMLFWALVAWVVGYKQFVKKVAGRGV